MMSEAKRKALAHAAAIAAEAIRDASADMVLRGPATIFIDGRPAGSISKIRFSFATANEGPKPDVDFPNLRRRRRKSTSSG